MLSLKQLTLSGRMKAVIHVRFDAQGHKVALSPGVVGRHWANQFFQRIWFALDLIQALVLDTAMGTQNGIAGADPYTGVGIDGACLWPNGSGEAGLDAGVSLVW